MRLDLMISTVLKQVKAQWRPHEVIYGILLCYIAVYTCMAIWFGISPHFAIGLIFLWFCAVLLFLFSSIVLFVKVVKILLSNSPGRPTQQLLAWSRAQILKHNRLGNVVHGVIIFGVAIFVFSTIKSAIPSIKAFAWDRQFMQMDRFIFWGMEPWRILHYFLGGAYTTTVISVLYSNVWLIAIAAVVSYSFVARDQLRRVQFILACILTWIVSGNVIAIILSSAGPCYYEFVVDGADPFASQMAFLREINLETGLVVSLQVQNLLWSTYVDSGGQVSGISAMPSLHIMFAFLIAIYIYRINRKIGGVLYLYAVIVLLGSVHLAWHYAVDGIAAMPLTALTWFVSGRIVEWSENRRCPAGPADVVG